MCRPRNAPTRPRLCRDAGSSVIKLIDVITQSIASNVKGMNRFVVSDLVCFEVIYGLLRRAYLGPVFQLESVLLLAVHVRRRSNQRRDTGADGSARTWTAQGD